ncbi:MAG: hypothetical protein ABL878_17350 [Burkholderiales bacterium]
MIALMTWYGLRPSTWLLLILVSVVALILCVVFGFLLLTFLTCLLEKQYVELLMPLDLRRALRGNAYFDVMNRMAAEAGFNPCGVFHANGKSRHSKVKSALWLSPDRTSLAMITGGTVAGFTYRKTFFYSRFSGGKVFVTRDDIGVGDLTGTRETVLLLNADFAELAGLHMTRVQGEVDTPICFTQTDAQKEFHEMESQRVNKLVELGFGRHLDVSCLTWKYTFKGAASLIQCDFRSQMEASEAQTNRRKWKRPGSRMQDKR